jgi:hypothetical protein
MSEIELTDEERRAIASLKRLAKRWPSTLWLFAGGSVDKVAILRTQNDGTRAMGSDQGVDQRYIVDHVDIPNDGGDW